jgi:hypothetical protein
MAAWGRHLIGIDRESTANHHKRHTKEDASTQTNRS